MDKLIIVYDDEAYTCDKIQIIGTSKVKGLVEVLITSKGRTQITNMGDFSVLPLKGFWDHVDDGG